jgi:hypothetical protein
MQMAEEFCEHIADGGSVREYCDQPGRPHWSTIRRWLRTHEQFRTQYARARADQADSLFAEIKEIADDARNDWMDVQRGDETVRVLDHEHVARSKLRIDARKWMAGKLRPKVYGEKIEATHEVGKSFRTLWEALARGEVPALIHGGGERA